MRVCRRLLSQIVCVVCCIVYGALQVSTELDTGYQIVMLISIVCLYAMILQYLLLIPEYMMERSIIVMEHAAGYVRFSAYVWSAMLTETPRAILQSCILLGVAYLIHPLNPLPINIAFSFICLIIGVCAWQSVITFCAVLTDKITFAYSMAFLILGSGTLFGGLLVRLSKIPVYFRIFYYISVAAVTQRALITNDMQCCYLSSNCNTIAKSIRDHQQTRPAVTDDYVYNSSTYHNHTIYSNQTAPDQPPSFSCPTQLQFTGDGSDDGNLGRLYLSVRSQPPHTPCCCYKPSS